MTLALEDPCLVWQGVELGDAGPSEATKGIEGLQSPDSQDLSAVPQAPQLQVSPCGSSDIPTSCAAAHGKNHQDAQRTTPLSVHVSVADGRPALTALQM